MRRDGAWSVPSLRNDAVVKTTKTFRFPPELAARLERHARVQRRSMTAVVEQALDKHLAVAEEGATRPNGRSGDTPASPAPSSVTAPTGHSAPPETDLAQYLSRRSGIPRALCVNHLKAGRVTIDGLVFRGLTVDGDALGQVRLDGEVV